MAKYRSSMTGANKYHVVVKNLAYCTTSIDLMVIFHKYGLEYVEIQRTSRGSQAFLTFLSFDSANIAVDAAANGIYLHSKKLKLQYSNYYNKSKMIMARPVVMNEINSIYSTLPMEIPYLWKLSQK